MPDSSPTIGLDDIALWHRFHVRLAALIGSGLIAVLTVLAIVLYQMAVRDAMTGLQIRLGTAVATLSATIDGDKVAGLPDTLDAENADVQAFHTLFEIVCASDPDIEDIYLLRPTDDPNLMVFILDHDTSGEFADIGEVFDISPYPQMAEGLSAPAVEDHLYTDKWGSSLSGYAPIRDAGGALVALVGIDVNADRIQLFKHRALVSTLVAYLITFVVVGLATGAAGERVRRPLERFLAATSAINQGDYHTRIHLDSQDEFGVLSRHFNGMASGLEERTYIQETFGRYFSDDVVELLMADRTGERLAGEEREVTVLFSDLVGYSTITESAEPKEVLALLNEYLERMNTVIEGHHGCVLEFIGDAILAIFGAPGDLPDHRAHAVRCAQEMRTELDKLNATWEETGRSELWRSQGINTLGARLGLHTGRVVAGNIGSSTMMKYGVVGDVVNVAARLEALNKVLGTSILMSGDTYILLPKELQAPLEELGPQPVKGRDKTVVVYGL
jgi:adenylate cyclase